MASRSGAGAGARPSRLRRRQARRSCRLLLTAPGVGTITALAYVAAVERPEEFKNGRAVSAWVGLTPARYQSGQIDVLGRISRQGDVHLLTYLYEAANTVLTRSRSYSAGPTKTLAKVANAVAKKNPVFGGTCDLMHPEVRAAVLRAFPAADVWGIGPASVRKLGGVGIATADTAELRVLIVGKRNDDEVYRLLRRR